MFEKTIVVKDIDSRSFYESIKPDIGGLSAKRFSVKANKLADSVEFLVYADDETALKAAESSIAKMEAVFKKMSKIN